MSSSLNGPVSTPSRFRDAKPTLDPGVLSTIWTSPARTVARSSRSSDPMTAMWTTWAPAGIGVRARPQATKAPGRTPRRTMTVHAFRITATSSPGRCLPVDQGDGPDSRLNRPHRAPDDGRCLGVRGLVLDPFLAPLRGRNARTEVIRDAGDARSVELDQADNMPAVLAVLGDQLRDPGGALARDPLHAIARRTAGVVPVDLDAAQRTGDALARLGPASDRIRREQLEERRIV